MKYAEIKGLSNAEITERINSEKQALSKLKMSHAVSPSENPMNIRKSRKTIARLTTELTKRK